MDPLQTKNPEIRTEPAPPIPTELPLSRKESLHQILSREREHRYRSTDPDRIHRAEPGESGREPLPAGHYYRNDGSIRVRTRKTESVPS